MNSLPNVTVMPFKLPGSIYRGCMPYSYNWHGKEDPIDVYKKVYDVTCVVILTSTQECMSFAHRNLPELYEKEGFKVVHFPIKDFSTPEMEPLSDLIEKIHELAMEKHNILIHCISGKGRTGLVMSCLAKKEFEMTGNDAVQWVRQSIPGAVETPKQEQFISDYTPIEVVVKESESTSDESKTESCDERIDCSQSLERVITTERSPSQPPESAPKNSGEHEQDSSPKIDSEIKLEESSQAERKETGSIRVSDRGNTSRPSSSQGDAKSSNVVVKMERVRVVREPRAFRVDHLVVRNEQLPRQNKPGKLPESLMKIFEPKLWPNDENK